MRPPAEKGRLLGGLSLGEPGSPLGLEALGRGEDRRPLPALREGLRVDREPVHVVLSLVRSRVCAPAWTAFPLGSEMKPRDVVRAPPSRALAPYRSPAPP